MLYKGTCTFIYTYTCNNNKIKKNEIKCCFSKGRVITVKLQYQYGTGQYIITRLICRKTETFQLFVPENFSGELY
jgi:hypothetical protein